MHSFLHRANALATFSVTILAIICRIASLSDNFHVANPTADVKVSKVNWFRMLPRGNDEVFVFVAAEYATPQNGFNQDWAPSCFYRVGGKKKQTMSDNAVVVARSPIGVNNYSRKPLRESKMAPANAVASVNEVKVPKVVSSFGRDDMWMERDYVWAHKYRPRFLREFICNRAQVDELEEMISLWDRIIQEREHAKFQTITKSQYRLVDQASQ